MAECSDFSPKRRQMAVFDGVDPRQIQRIALQINGDADYLYVQQRTYSPQQTDVPLTAKCGLQQ